MQARLMADRLPMRANRPDGCNRQSHAVQERLDDLRIGDRKRISSQRAAMQFVGPASIQRKKSLAQARVKSTVHVCPNNVLGWMRQVCKYTVDAVHRGAGHQADVDMGSYGVVDQDVRRRRINLGCGCWSSLGAGARTDHGLGGIELAQRRS